MAKKVTKSGFMFTHKGLILLTEDEYQEYLILKDEKGHRWITNTEELEFANLRKWYKLSKQGNLITDAELKEYQSLKLDSENGVFISDDQYCEYLDLKKFKESCDKDCEEWDKGIQLEYNCPEENKACSCKHIPWMEWDKGIETKQFKGTCARCGNPVGSAFGHMTDIHSGVITFSCDQETLNWNNPTAYHQPKDITQQISTLKFNQDQIIGRQYDERDRVDVLEDRLDDIEAEIRSDRKTQKLINGELYGRLTDLAAMVERQEDVRSELEDQGRTVVWSITTQAHPDNLQDMETSKPTGSKKRSGRAKNNSR